MARRSAARRSCSREAADGAADASSCEGVDVEPETDAVALDSARSTHGTTRRRPDAAARRGEAPTALAQARPPLVSEEVAGWHCDRDSTARRSTRSSARERRHARLDDSDVPARRSTGCPTSALATRLRRRRGARPQALDRRHQDRHRPVPGFGRRQLARRRAHGRAGRLGVARAPARATSIEVSAYKADAARRGADAGRRCSSTRTASTRPRRRAQVARPRSTAQLGRVAKLLGSGLLDDARSRSSRGEAALYVRPRHAAARDTRSSSRSTTQDRATRCSTGCARSPSGVAGAAEHPRIDGRARDEADRSRRRRSTTASSTASSSSPTQPSGIRGLVRGGGPRLADIAGLPGRGRGGRACPTDDRGFVYANVAATRCRSCRRSPARSRPTGSPQLGERSSLCGVGRRLEVVVRHGRPSRVR